MALDMRGEIKMPMGLFDVPLLLEFCCCLSIICVEGGKKKVER
jgi:hypothetical protein